MENNQSRFQQNTKVGSLKAALRNIEPSLDSLVAVTLHREGSHLNTPVVVLWLPFASCAPVAAPAAAPRAAGSSKTLISANEDLREVFAQASRVCACIACAWTRRLEGGVGQWRVEAMLVLNLCNETNCNAKARRERRNRAGFGGRLISENPPVRVDAYFTL